MATATVLLDGSRSSVTGAGYFIGWNWRQIKGNPAVITNPKLQVTETVITKGDYAWELTGTDNLKQIGKDTVEIKY